MEQEEYKREKIAWQNVKYDDNMPCIELIESIQSKSIFKILDEECMLKSNDAALLRKLNDQLQTSKYYGRPKNLKDGANKFTVKHYAGEVTYDINSFIEKNKDSVND